MFYEDSRIVSKNIKHNIAYKLVQSLRDAGLSDQDIELNMHSIHYMTLHTIDPEIRNDICKEILKIVKRGKTYEAVNC